MNLKSAKIQQFSAILRVSCFAVALSFADATYALDTQDSYETMTIANQSWLEVLAGSPKNEDSLINGFSSSNKPNVASPRVLAQQRNSSDSSGLRSKSEVVREVKRKYDAEVLKISLNSSGNLYRVRILMPNGRIRDVSVSARR